MWLRFDNVLFCARIGAWGESDTGPQGCVVSTLGRAGTVAVETTAAIIIASVSTKPFSDAAQAEAAEILSRCGASRFCCHCAAFTCFWMGPTNTVRVVLTAALVLNVCACVATAPFLGVVLPGGRHVSVPESEMTGRVDFRGECVISIDQEDCPDRDDCIHVKQIGAERYQVRTSHNMGNHSSARAAIRLCRARYSAAWCVCVVCVRGVCAWCVCVVCVRVWGVHGRWASTSPTCATG